MFNFYPMIQAARQAAAAEIAHAQANATTDPSQNKYVSTNMIDTSAGPFFIFGISTISNTEVWTLG
jgi:hypothetical protein